MADLLVPLDFFDSSVVEPSSLHVNLNECF